MKKTRTWTARITQEQYEAAKQKCDEDGVGCSDVTRALLDAWLAGRITVRTIVVQFENEEGQQGEL